MYSKLASRSYSLLAGAIASVGLSLTAIPAFAADFAFKDSSTIALDGSNVTVESVGNVRNVLGLAAVNTGDTAVEAGYIVPFLWAISDGAPVSLNWDNDLDGWFTADYDGLGTSLLIETLLPDRLPLGDLANITGESPFPLTQPCNDDPSCVQRPFPSITQQSDDAIPFLNLGTLAAGESRSFDQSFLFTFGDNREGVLPVAPSVYTISRIPQDVPEPASVMAIVIVGGTMTLMKRKKALA